MRREWNKGWPLRVPSEWQCFGVLHGGFGFNSSIAVAAIGVYRLFGDTVRQQMAGLANELSGESGKSAGEAAKTSAGKAETAAKTKRDLSNYYDGNQK